MYDADDILKSKTFKMKTKNCKNMMQFAECVVPHLNCICIWSIGNTVTWECRYNNGMEYSQQYFPCLANRCYPPREALCVLDCCTAGWRGPNSGHIWSPLKPLQSRSSLRVQLEVPGPDCSCSSWWVTCAPVMGPPQWETTSWANSPLKKKPESLNENHVTDFARKSETII